MSEIRVTVYQRSTSASGAEDPEVLQTFWHQRTSAVKGPAPRESTHAVKGSLGLGSVLLCTLGFTQLRIREVWWLIRE